MGAVARDWLGLSGLSVTERLFMVGGAFMGLLAWMWLRQLFGGLIRQLPPRRPSAKKKPKAKKKPAAKRGRR